MIKERKDDYKWKADLSIKKERKYSNLVLREGEENE